MQEKIQAWWKKPTDGKVEIHTSKKWDNIASTAFLAGDLTRHAEAIAQAEITYRLEQNEVKY